MFELIKKTLGEALAVKQAMLHDAALQAAILTAAEAMVSTFRAEGKVLFCGNGGSAADAQHLAAELSGRFYRDRPALFAEALHVNTSYLTAVANDYGYDAVFARMVEAAGKAGDVLVAISTSGNSPNILRAIEAAKQKNMLVIGMTGAGGGKLAQLSDILLSTPSTDTPRIQEGHILMGHIMCDIIEKMLFGHGAAS